MVRVAGERKIKTVLHSDQPLHRVRRGRIHANLAIPIHSHETKRRIDCLIHYCQVKAMFLGDSRPVMNAGTAQRINSETKLRTADDFEINNVVEVVDVGSQIIVLMRRRGTKSLFVRNALYSSEL